MDDPQVNGTSWPSGSLRTSSSRTMCAGSFRFLAYTRSTRLMDLSGPLRISSSVCLFYKVCIASALIDGQMCSNHCLKWQKTLDLIQSYTYFCNVSLVLILSTTNPKLREEYTRSFHIQDFGISPSRLRIHTGGYIFLIQPKEHVLKTFRLYYMFANMASLNRWRRVRGFSEFIILKFHPNHVNGI